MVRKIVALEGKSDGHGLFIEKGALDFSDQKYPLTWMGDYQKLPIGVATDFRREEDGYITAEITFYDESTAELSDDVDYSVYANQVVEDKPQEKVMQDRHVTYARVRCVTTTLSAGWPVEDTKKYD